MDKVNFKASQVYRLHHEEVSYCDEWLATSSDPDGGYVCALMND